MEDDRRDSKDKSRAGKIELEHRKLLLEREEKLRSGQPKEIMQVLQQKADTLRIIGIGVDTENVLEYLRQEEWLRHELQRYGGNDSDKQKLLDDVIEPVARLRRIEIIRIDVR